MAKKVGVASPYKDYNYGTVLQAFALYKRLDRLGVSVEYLDYSASAALSKWKRVIRYITRPKQLWVRFTKRKVENPIVAFLQSSDFTSNRIKFDEFIDMIPTSRQYDINTINRADNEYDIFIVGSDQTWSPFLNDEDSLYFLNFTSGIKKNSYAPSLGTSNITDEYKKILKNKLASFNNISCREGFGASLISKLIERPVNKVLDPTLLLCAPEWIDYEKKVENLNYDYILLYQLGTRDSLINFAETLSERTGLKIVSILTNEYTKTFEHTINSVGPSEFLWLIHHASYVVTDSFHGTIFSVNFGRQFYSFTKVCGDESCFDNARLRDFLSTMGLENHLIVDVECIPLPEIDYLEVNKRLEEERIFSLSYLQTIVEN